MVMRGHTARIGGAIWDREDRNRVWSAAWDGTVRGWEADIGFNSVLKVRSFPLMCIAYGGADVFGCSKDRRTRRRCVSIRWRCLERWRRVIWTVQSACGIRVKVCWTHRLHRIRLLTRARTAQSLISLTLSTSSPVPSLRAHPTSQFTLATGTYSGNLQIWDIRSPKQALFSVRRQQKEGKGERVLGIDWNGEIMVAGGEDGEVSVWSARGE